MTGGTVLTSGGGLVKLTILSQIPLACPIVWATISFQSPNLFKFDEDQNILLTCPLIVNVGSSTIPTGNFVASHYIFFDPGPSQCMTGTVNFDSDILAVITTTNDLAASDSLRTPASVI